MKLSSLKIFRLDGIEDFQYMYRCTPGCKRLHMRRPFRIWKSSRTDFREIQAFLPAEWVDSGITQHFPEGVHQRVTAPGRSQSDSFRGRMLPWKVFGKPTDKLGPGAGKIAEFPRPEFRTPSASAKDAIPGGEGQPQKILPR